MMRMLVASMSPSKPAALAGGALSRGHPTCVQQREFEPRGRPTALGTCGGMHPASRGKIARMLAWPKLVAVVLLPPTFQRRESAQQAERHNPGYGRRPSQRTPW
eukprot:4635509-Pyramimonas_sp.AAC.1